MDFNLNNMKVYVGERSPPVILDKNILFFIVNFCLMVLSSSLANADQSFCHSVLWPNNRLTVHSDSEEELSVLQNLQQWSNKFLKKSPNSIPVLGSAGKINITDSNLISSRKALQDADHAAVLALTFALTNNTDYLNKTRDILLSWSVVNQPTGNPVDETRLEGMIWAYDLVSCFLVEKDREIIESWFDNMRAKKLSWKFGPLTTNNNHRIHQQKMILLLDKILNRDEDWKDDLAKTQKYSEINLNVITGESIDYKERDALYYHNYDLQSWLEISLISGCCKQPVTQAFNFLSNHILSHNIGGEFLYSNAKIDKLRDEGGFEYAKKGGNFDVKKAASTIVMYYTLVPDKPDNVLMSIVHDAKPSPWLSFLTARKVLWLSQPK
jgi:hypothetical protein